MKNYVQIDFGFAEATKKRMSNNECRILLRRTSSEGMYANFRYDNRIKRFDNKAVSNPELWMRNL